MRARPVLPLAFIGRWTVGGIHLGPHAAVRRIYHASRPMRGSVIRPARWRVAFLAFQPYAELPNAGSAVPGTFSNFEVAHVHPLDMTPDGAKLLAVNT